MYHLQINIYQSNVLTFSAYQINKTQSNIIPGVAADEGNRPVI